PAPARDGDPDGVRVPGRAGAQTAGGRRSFVGAHGRSRARGARRMGAAVGLELHVRASIEPRPLWPRPGAIPQTAVRRRPRGGGEGGGRALRGDRRAGGRGAGGRGPLAATAKSGRLAAESATSPATGAEVGAGSPYAPADGQGHREADPPALSDLLPDGQPTAGVGARDQAGGGGLQLDERGRVRAPLLR